MGKIHYKWAIFYGYVNLPEGILKNSPSSLSSPPFCDSTGAPWARRGGHVVGFLGAQAAKAQKDLPGAGPSAGPR